MVYEHEIPKGSKLYFGKSARIKRELERVASDILYSENFQEIATPFFSLHQHLSINPKDLIRFSNTDNQLLSLRSDSTMDVVRLITRRLGRATSDKRWFYIQPVFRYPSEEIYQIGGECIGELRIDLCINSIIKVFKHFDINPLLFISNVKIPKIVSKLLDIPMEVFEKMHIKVLLDRQEKWLQELIALQKEQDIDRVIKISPKEIAEELTVLKKLFNNISYENKVLEPMFYSKMRYYDSIYFSFIDKNDVLARGGSYSFEKQDSVGFGIYSDNLIEMIMKIKAGDNNE